MLDDPGHTATEILGPGDRRAQLLVLAENRVGGYETFESLEGGLRFLEVGAEISGPGQGLSE